MYIGVNVKIVENITAIKHIKIGNAKGIPKYEENGIEIRLDKQNFFAMGGFRKFDRKIDRKMDRKNDIKMTI